jgi:hypothetical protein
MNLKLARPRRQTRLDGVHELKPQLFSGRGRGRVAASHEGVANATRLPNWCRWKLVG